MNRIEELLEDAHPLAAANLDELLGAAARLICALSADDEVVSVIIHDRLDLALATRRGTSLH